MQRDRATKIVSFVQICFGAMIAAGSAAELLISAVPGVLPPEILDEYARLHVSWSVRAWVVMQNLLALGLGLGFVVAGVGLRRGRAAAEALTRRCAVATIALMVTSQLVLTVALYRDVASGALSVGAPTETIAFMVLASVGVTIWPLCVLLFLRRRGRSAPAS